MSEAGLKTVTAIGCCWTTATWKRLFTRRAPSGAPFGMARRDGRARRLKAKYPTADEAGRRPRRQLLKARTALSGGRRMISGSRPKRVVTTGSTTAK